MNFDGEWRLDEDGEIRAYDEDVLVDNIAIVYDEQFGPLIAAAPELFEALENDVRFFESIANDERWEATGIGNLCRGYATRRRKVLAKARGEAL